MKKKQPFYLQKKTFFWKTMCLFGKSSLFLKLWFPEKNLSFKKNLEKREKNCEKKNLKKKQTLQKRNHPLKKKLWFFFKKKPPFELKKHPLKWKPIQKKTLTKKKPLSSQKKTQNPLRKNTQNTKRRQTQNT